MKRLLFVVAFLVAIAAATPSLAQNGAAKLMFDQATPIADIVEALAGQIGNTVVWQPTRPTETMQGEVNVSQLKTAIRSLVSQHGYQVTEAGDVFTISKGTPAPTSTNGHSATAAQVQDDGTAMQNVTITRADFCRQYSCVGMTDQDIAESMAWAAHQAQQRAMPRYAQGNNFAVNYSIPNRNFGGVIGGVNGQYVANTYGVDPYAAYGYSQFSSPWMEGCISGGPTGYLKFKYDGRNSDRKYWRIYLNGEYVGSLDQGDSFWNQISVCAGSVTIQIKRLAHGPSGISEHNDKYSIRPWTTTEVTVGDYLFEHDSHAQLRKRVLVEK